MISSIKEILTKTAARVKNSIKLNPKFLATKHFQERLLQRFEDEDIPKIERAIEKAFLKAKPGSKIRYTHPAYGCTIVGKKMGLNGFELLTCWKKEEDAE